MDTTDKMARWTEWTKQKESITSDKQNAKWAQRLNTQSGQNG